MKALTLLEVVARLSAYDDQSTIYAIEPWRCESPVAVAREPEEGGLPAEATRCGAVYFLEVSIANDFLQGWLEHERRPVSFRQQCERLIHYATHDA
jgi:hypothetical protein